MAASPITKNYNINISKLFIIFLAWISFFPQPLQEHYNLFAKSFLAILFLVSLRQEKSMHFLFSRENLPLWVFLLCILGSVFFADNRQIAIKTYLDISLTLAFLYFLAKRMFSSDRYAIPVIKAICIFSFIVALLAIFEQLFRRNLYYEYIIENPYYRHFIGLRPMSTQFNPSPLASFLLACLPFNILLTKDKVSFFRSLGAVSLIVNAIVIMLTLSRSAFLGLIGLSLFYLWIIKKKLLCGLFFVMFVLFIALCSQPNIGKGFDHFGTRGIMGKEKRALLSNYRILRWKMALDMVKDHIFFGVGLNHFRIKFSDYNSEDNGEVQDIFKIADNMYLTLLAETGVIGFSGFIFFLICLFRKGLGSLYGLKNGKEREIVLIALSALVGLLINIGGYELFYWYNPFALFCIHCGIVAASPHKE